MPGSYRIKNERAPSRLELDPLKILQVVRPAAGGMRRHVSLLSSGLMARGHEMQAAIPPPHFLQGDQHLIHRPVPIRAKPSPYGDLRAAAILSAIANEEFDIVHAHGVRAAWVTALACAGGKRPFLWTAHNLAPHARGLSAMALRFAARRCRAAIAVSRAVAESFAPLGIPASRFTVIPNGIPLEPIEEPRGDVRKELRISSEAPVVLAIGRLAPEKGFDLIIEAFALLKTATQQAASLQPRATAPALTLLAASSDAPVLVIAGEGPERARLQALASDFGVADRVQLLGYVDDTASLYAAASVICVPSRLEGQGIVALEAMAARKPVVATAVGGLVETVIDGETGLLTKPDDAEALASALGRLLEERALAARMGASGRARVEAEYGVERMIDRNVELYESLLQKRDAQQIRP